METVFGTAGIGYGGALEAGSDHCDEDDAGDGAECWKCHGRGHCIDLAFWQQAWRLPYIKRICDESICKNKQNKKTMSLDS